MGLLDKVKEQASKGLEKATQAGVAGQAKLDALAAKRKVDALLRDIGAAVYAQQTSGTAADIQPLIDQIRQIEAEHGPVVGQSSTDGDDSDAPGAAEGAAE